MSSSWRKRKLRLSELLNCPQEEDEEGLVLDRILHGQNVIGKTSKTVEIDKLRFTDNDLDTLGTLDRGQFGKIDVVSCTLDGRVYVRKSLEKMFVLRNRDQCFPQLERDLLLRAHRTNSNWAPHLLCAFQTSTHLNLVMDFAEGGTLWDVLESSPLDGKISESDITWWAPQVVSAINWCHQEGFVHRDIKPHNFVLTKDSYVLLIDFSSAAPLLPDQQDGSRLVPKRYCFVPCGTCDYIAPEILQAHEEALVALEMSAEGSSLVSEHAGGYGVEIDWWSLGAMLYEMVYGVAPFFADDIKQTYLKIMNHERHLKFDKSFPVSRQLRGLLQRFLTTADKRLGRKGIAQIVNHDFFSGVTWSAIRDRPKPSHLHLPQFSYDPPVVGMRDNQRSYHHDSSVEDMDPSRSFAFSTALQSSRSLSLGVSSLRMTPASKFSRSTGNNKSLASFIGFSWGPCLPAFAGAVSDAPRQIPFCRSRDEGSSQSPHLPVPLLEVDSNAPLYPFSTPVRTRTSTPHQTLPRTSTILRTAPRRAVSDREAMKQLVDLVGMNARKKVIESGRKPRILTMSSFSGSRSRSGTLKELRFNTSPAYIGRRSSLNDSSRMDVASSRLPQISSLSLVDDENTTDTETETDVPPSPSPRPGSAMSIMSRRSQTPTTTGSFGVGGPELTNATLHPNTFTSLNDHDTLSDDVLDDFDERHAHLLADITGLRRRLEQLASQAH